MLRYSVKPKGELSLSTFPYENFYVSQDASFISGVSDYNVGLVNGEQVLIKSPCIENGSESNELIVYEALRQGRIEVELELNVKTITRTLNFNVYDDDVNGIQFIDAYNRQIELPGELSGEEQIYSAITQNYVSYNGEISYFFHGDSEDKCGYIINNKFYKASETDETIRIKEYLYIDDGKLVVGENTYYVDFSKLPTDESLKPELKLSRYVGPITGGSYLGDIDGEKCYASSASDGSLVIDSYNTNEWRRVLKFRILKKIDPYLAIDEVLYGKYRHFITVEDRNFYFKDVIIDDGSISHGVLVNDKFYSDPAIEYEPELEKDYRDGVEIAGHYIDIDGRDKSYVVKNELSSSDRKGVFLIIVLRNEKLDIIEDDKILAESTASFNISKQVEEDDVGTLYVDYMGVKHEVEKKMFDTVVLSGVEYRLEYTDNEYSAATANVGGENLELFVKYFLTDDYSVDVPYSEYESSTSETKCVRATINKKVFYKEDGLAQTIVRYDIHSNAYNVIENSGVTINGTTYKVKKYFVNHFDGNEYDENDNHYSYFVEMYDDYKFTLYVDKIYGSSTLVCYPMVDSDLYSDADIDEISREIVKIIGDNKNYFRFKLIKNTFGREIISAENGLMQSMTARTPYSTHDGKLLEKSIKIYRFNEFLSFKFPLTTNVANNLNREDVVNNEFVEYVKDSSINRIVDMEKDVYYPTFKVNADNEQGYEFRQINQIRFNLHFRTRNLENWKVIEDDREYTRDPFNEHGEFYTPNSLMCNWFVTDYGYYNDSVTSHSVNKKNLHNSSDLLGYLNFTTNEVISRASKIGKSFLRLSFYSTNNPQTQVLLGTSTIFFDENLALAKYISLKKNSDLNFIDTIMMEKAGYKTVDEYIQDVESGKAKYQVSANTTNTSSEINGDSFLNDSFRLSSRFTVLDKYNCDTSSEGYYLYMFKEYVTNNREDVIYMKVDFNHAGVGQSIPFLLPRKDLDEVGVGTPLYLDSQEDVKVLKKGFKLKDIYKQLYLPIYVKYDINTNKYVYYLDEVLRENDHLSVNDEIMEFNLFEVKFENESLRGEDEGN